MTAHDVHVQMMKDIREAREEMKYAGDLEQMWRRIQCQMVKRQQFARRNIYLWSVRRAIQEGA